MAVFHTLLALSSLFFTS